MRKFTKAVSAFLSAVMLMSVVLSAPYAVSASSTTDDMEKIGVPLYQANVIANGYNNDGEGYYKLFKSLQDPLYYQLTDYMLEDDVLCWTSNFWNAAFNSEFQDNPSYFYEVMLMGFLKYDQNQINTSGVWNSKEMALSTSIYNTIASNYIDKFENPSYKDFVKQVNELSNDELKNILSNIEDIKITKQALEVLSKGCSYGAEFINAVVDYQALLDAKSERIELLKLAKAKVTDNEYFSKAVDDIIDKMEQTPIEYVSGQMLDKIWDDFLDSAWDLIIKGSPIATVLKAIDIEKMTLDVLFNTSETASDNFKLLVLYIVDTYFSSALEQAYDNYKSSGTVSNAATLIQCYRAYIEYQVYGLDYTKTFINNIVDGGTIHHIIEQIFFQESIESAAELTQHCDNQIRNRKNLLESLDKSADIYYSSTGLDELVDVLGSTDEDDVNIPVTGISFKQSEITLNSTEDICVISADVYPSNATNKKVNYTSSDPSILSVPSDGGFATQNGEGTVTITATTEDGGFTATQKVIVNYTHPLTVRSQGKCGSNVYWTIYSDGTLYINGTGSISNYSYFGPWGEATEIYNVVLSRGITSIGMRAFRGCSNIENITIPNTVTYIGYAAFACTISGNVGKKVVHYRGTEKEWNNIQIENKHYGNIELTSATRRYTYDDFEYSNSNSIAIMGYIGKSKDLVIPSTIEEYPVKGIGNGAFSNVTSITSVTIPNSVTSIENNAFSGCTSLRSITIPDSINKIGNNAFENCIVKDLIISGSSKKITSNMVVCKETLEKVVIANSVTYIDYGAFLNCTRLTNIVIPNSVTSIGDRVFSDCTSLTSITIPDSVTHIGDYAFANCTNLTSITIPNSVTNIDDYAFSGCTSLTSITIPNSMTEINKQTFSGCTNLTSITIPNSVTNIDDYAFSGCTSLTSITINEGIKKVSDNAFEGCFIKELIISDSSERLTSNMVICKGTLKKIKIPDNVSSIEDSALSDCVSLTSVTIPNSVTSIGNSVFSGCTSLVSVSLPNSVTSIGNSVFSGCTSLVSVSLPNSVTSIGNSVFSGCTNLASITIPDSVTNIGAFAFYSCTSLTSITIPESINRIAYGTFYNCENLNSIVIPNSITNIEDIAFKNCVNLKSVTISDKITEYGDYIFENCTVNELIVADGAENISGCMMLGRELDSKSTIKKVVIPDSVTTIDTNAFKACTSLEYFDISENSTVFSSIDGVIFSKDGSQMLFYPKGRKDFSYTIPYGVKTIGCSSLGDHITSIILPDSVTTINDWALEFCENLASITISDSLISIGKHAFYYCNNIKEIIIAEGSEKVSEEMIDFCYSVRKTVEKIVIPSSVTFIEMSKISKFSNLKEFIVNENNEEFSSDEGVLLNKEKTKIIMYPQGKTDSVYIIPDEVEAIDDDAFSNCSNLTSVSIPNSVTSIGWYAFYGCTGLTDVYYDGSIEEWNEIFIDDDNDYLLDANIHYTYKLSQNVSGIQPNYDLSYGAKPFNLNAKAKTPLSYVSSNPKVAYVSSNGIVTIKGVGIATITITAKENNAYNSATATVKINVRKAIQRVTGVKTRYVTSVGKTFIFKPKAKTKLTYSSSNKNVAVVSSTGKVTVKAGGYAYITVKASENGNYKSAYVKTKIISAPRNFTSKDISKVKKTGKTTAKITWKSLAGAKGYTVQLATNKSYKGAKTVKNSKNTANFTNLKKGKTYYVRINAYTKVSGKNYSNKWYTLKFKM